MPSALTAPRAAQSQTSINNEETPDGHQTQTEDAQEMTAALNQPDQSVAPPVNSRPPPSVYCDRCTKNIDGIRYKCQQCPDFDYCISCVPLANSIHPAHEFVPFRGKEALSGEELIQHSQSIGTAASDSTAFRLLGQDVHMPTSLCLSCQPVTVPLPAVDIILQDEKVRQQRKNGLQLRWPARISKLVEATVSGCAFCSLVLCRFFGPGNGISWSYEPQTPWVCQTDSDFRRSVIEHAMHLLTIMKSDKFVFAVEPIHAKGSAGSDITRLRIELKEAKQDKEVLDQALASRGQQYIELDVYAAEGNPAADKITSRPPNPSPGSEKALDQVVRWLAQCEEKHSEACAARQSRLPTRVIDVSDPAELRLVETDEDSSGRYVALSYCWGGTQDFQTTAKTLGDRIDGFEVSDLPQTLQDAVTVTRALKISYLWVDSICIVQDDSGDRAHELENMGDIYKHAVLTISASKADAASKGFLSDEANPQTGLWKNLIPLGFSIPDPSAKSIDDAFEMPRKVFGTIWLCDEDPNMMSTFRSPVDRRGWCLQEKLLSSRMLSYGRWPTWRCSQATHSDGGFYPQKSRKEKYERQLARSLLEQRRIAAAGIEKTTQVDVHTSNQLLQSWYKLVNEYTQRELGLKSDRLPAIGGIAAEIARVTGFTYLAGLWQPNLLHDLMWSAKAKEWLTRPSKDYTGPTWSWARVDCPVSYEDVTEDSFALAHVLSSAVETGPSGPFGEAGKGSRLEIEAPFFPLVNREVLTALLQDQSMARPPPKSNDVNEWYRQIMEFVNSQPKGDSRQAAAEEKWKEHLPEQVSAVILFTRDWKVVDEQRFEGVFYSGLLLRKVGSGYERIGAFFNEERGWMDQSVAPWEGNTIVLV